VLRPVPAEREVDLVHRAEVLQAHVGGGIVAGAEGVPAALDRVLGADADVTDQLLHDRRVVAARVQAEGHPVGMAEVGDAPL